MNLRVELEHFRSVLIVRLYGELDHHTADKVRIQMEDAIGKKNINDVVLSLKGLEFMDSSGLGVFWEDTSCSKIKAEKWSCVMPVLPFIGCSRCPACLKLCLSMSRSAWRFLIWRWLYEHEYS